MLAEQICGDTEVFSRAAKRNRRRNPRATVPNLESRIAMGENVGWGEFDDIGGSCVASNLNPPESRGDVVGVLPNGTMILDWQRSVVEKDGMTLTELDAKIATAGLIALGGWVGMLGKFCIDTFGSVVVGKERIKIKNLSTAQKSEAGIVDGEASILEAFPTATKITLAALAVLPVAAPLVSTESNYYAGHNQPPCSGGKPLSPGQVSTSESFGGPPGLYVDLLTVMPSGGDNGAMAAVWKNSFPWPEAPDEWISGKGEGVLVRAWWNLPQPFGPGEENLTLSVGGGQKICQDDQGNFFVKQ